MNKKQAQIATFILAIVSFAGGALLYRASQRVDDRVVPPAAMTATTEYAPSVSVVPVEPAAPQSALVQAFSPLLGRVDAPVTVVEFFDPACETCALFHPVVERLLTNYPDDVRVVLRYTPLHGVSEEAIRILEAARLQNLFKPVFDALLTRQAEWAAHGAGDTEKAWAIAAEAGVDIAKGKAEVTAESLRPLLLQESIDRTTFKIQGTPTFFINGQPLKSLSWQELLDEVRAEVEKTKASRE